MFAQHHINLFFGLLIGCIFIRLFLCETSEKFDSLVLSDENGNIKKFGGSATDIGITMPNGTTKKIMRINENGELVVTSGLVVDENDAKRTAPPEMVMVGGLGGLMSVGASGAKAAPAPSIKGIYMGTGTFTGTRGNCVNTRSYKHFHNLNLTGAQFIFTQSTNVAPTSGNASFPGMRVVAHDPNSFEVTICNNHSDIIMFNWIIFLT